MVFQKRTVVRNYLQARTLPDTQPKYRSTEGTNCTLHYVTMKHILYNFSVRNLKTATNLVKIELVATQELPTGCLTKRKIPVVKTQTK